MTSFESTATPSTVSKLVVSPSKDSNTALQGPTVASIDSGPVQAYAKLEGDDFCYYIRTLQVTLGRKVSNPENVDILLGNTKSVSRQHARLFFNFSTQRFELMVLGKNGAFVNERFIEKGVTVPLENKTKIQIGEMAFVFLLPRPEADNVNKNNNTKPRNMEDFGYISTPQQLEKITVSNKTSLQPVETDPRDDSAAEDDHSETSEPNTNTGNDIKPPYSYASLIAQAINSSKDKKMTLNGIYNYITVNFPYYQLAQNGWQNSIRHNLSLNKAFVKVPRGDAEPGKGAFWTIDPNAEMQFTNGIYKRNKRTSAPIVPLSHYSKLENDSPRKKSKKDHELAPTHQSEEYAHAKLVGMGELKEGPSDLVDPSSVSKATAVTLENIQVAMLHPFKGDTKVDTQIGTASASTHVEDTDTQDKTSSEKTTSASQNGSQAQLQMQLQNTIRQHLLDPARYPLPPSIAQLLPQAIAQLPPQLATQLSSTLNTTLKTTSEGKENNPTQK